MPEPMRVLERRAAEALRPTRLILQRSDGVYLELENGSWVRLPITGEIEFSLPDDDTHTAQIKLILGPSLSASIIGTGYKEAG